MGAIFFVIYKSNACPINMSFCKSFMNMVYRGKDESKLITDHMPQINRINGDIIKKTLTRTELREYAPLSFVLGYHRLSINDMTLDGSQPFEDPIEHMTSIYPDLRTRPKRKLICNGEIYNCFEIIKKEGFSDRDLQSKSDVEVILPLYIKHGIEKTLKELDGEFSFVLAENMTSFNMKKINVYVARDKLGAKPLYMIKSKKELFYMFTSELKGIPKELLRNNMYDVCEVPIGCYWSFQNSIVEKKENEFICYNDWTPYKSLDVCTFTQTDPVSLDIIYSNIRNTLADAVQKLYTTSDANVGVLLSGGFDGSIILSLLMEFISKNSFSRELNVFTLAEKDSQDAIEAQKCVCYLEDIYGIRVKHHVVSVDMPLSSYHEYVKQVVYATETYDSYTIKGGIPLHVLMEYISKNTDVRVLLTGEGLDELCGYDELTKLPDMEFQKKSVELLENVSKFDIMRIEKIAGVNGLEVRHPFLDEKFIKLLLSIHPKLRRPQVFHHSQPPIEKYIVRKAFHVSTGQTYLPNDIVWKKMGETSMCLSNIRKLEEYYNSFYSDNDFFAYISQIKDKRAIPKKKEEMFYQKVFEEMFGIPTFIDKFRK
jgi:asparagine synthase (glutamine-hydrolysing)